MPPKNLFISCVSNEFGQHRLRLANQLGALPGQPFQVSVQEDFRQGSGSLLERLDEAVRACDCVIHLVGEQDGYGIGDITPEHLARLYSRWGLAVPADVPARSYTQWEYWLARHHQRPTLVYFLTPPAGTPPAPAPTHTAQAVHRQAIRATGEHRKAFGTAHQLVREVFHDLGLEPDYKANTLPYAPLGSLFKGRADFLAKLRAALGEVQYAGHGRHAAITSGAAATMHGLGGIGKTRAAVEFAHQHGHEYTALLFLPSDSPTQLHDSLARLCGVLQLPEADVPQQPEQVQAALAWLRQHPGWLLILDNVDDEPAARAVSELLGQLRAAGQVIITSRISQWPGDVTALGLDVLRPEDAADFLIERTAGKRARAATEAADHADALAIGHDLGHLALALEQAGAYIAATNLSLAQYRKAWVANHDAVLGWFDERVMHYPKSVAITWQTSVKKLGLQAQTLLNWLAWLAPKPIPAVLAEGTITTPLGTGLIVNALAELARYSLVTWEEPDRTSFMVHQLVQDVTRQKVAVRGWWLMRWFRKRMRIGNIKPALHWINDDFVGDPQDVRNWPILERLLPHALAVASYANEAGIATPTIRLLNQSAQLLDAKYHMRDAEVIMRQALAISMISFGPNHSNVAACLNNLATLLYATNRMGEAEPLMRQALAVSEACFGPDHPDVAIRLNNIGILLRDTNRLGEAEPLMRRALAIDEATFGLNDPKVARGLNNLAQLLYATSRLGDAETMMRRALAIVEVSFGPDHPEMATCLNNLAQLVQATNRFGEAELLMRQALVIDEDSFEPNHPNVARDLNNLSALLFITNRLAEAEPLMRRALAIVEAGFGSDHPQVAIRLINLAALLQANNQMEEAESLMRRALAIDEASFGPDHPQVATDLNNLAGLLRATRRLEQAELLMRRHLVIFIAFSKQTGHEHPQLRVDSKNYGSLLLEMGYSSENALAILRRLLQGEADLTLPPPPTQAN